jgi:glycine/D-amino acid oxidase-like deaminating enzyme
MSRVSVFLVLLLCTLGAGCAGSRATLVDAAPIAAGAAAAAAPSQLAVGATQPTVVDGNQLAQREVPICREILKSNSNVHVRQCMTASAWKRWERQEAERAEATVRMLQGSRYQ